MHEVPIKEKLRALNILIIYNKKNVVVQYEKTQANYLQLYTLIKVLH